MSEALERALTEALAQLLTALHTGDGVTRAPATGGGVSPAADTGDGVAPAADTGDGRTRVPDTGTPGAPAADTGDGGTPAQATGTPGAPAPGAPAPEPPAPEPPALGAPAPGAPALGAPASATVVTGSAAEGSAAWWTGRTASVLGRLAPDDRRRLTRLLHETAAREPDPARREPLTGLAERLGPDADRHARYCDAVEEQVARFVKTVRDADPATAVPTCPGWTLADLIRHLGTTHRWMEHLVRTRAAARVHSRDVPLDLPADPADAAAQVDWLARSADAALRTLRAADPDAAVWSPGADPHARFFPRRLLFEAVVHLADAELALGAVGTLGAVGSPSPLGAFGAPGDASRVEPGVAADGVEEFLENLPYFAWIAEPVSQLGREGASLRLCAADTGAAWTLTLAGGGFTWHRDRHRDGDREDGDRHGVTADVTVTAAGTGELLLLLHGRYRPGDRRFTVSGDRTLLDAWLSATRF
ncbi:maleylpyruvate isomerase N-terminal domain-containing protein [Streptomyces sp. NPDC047928]|uniref:maleylpyruvate isomerase N-terminal domain-containing protein n=1 Tax=unclassified Streptomyces TaxID=2593676 RepID=UPI00371B9EF4